MQFGADLSLETALPACLPCSAQAGIQDFHQDVTVLDGVCFQAWQKKPFFPSANELLERELTEMLCGDRLEYTILEEETGKVLFPMGQRMEKRQIRKLAIQKNPLITQPEHKGRRVLDTIKLFRSED